MHSRLRNKSTLRMVAWCKISALCTVGGLHGVEGYLVGINCVFDCTPATALPVSKCMWRRDGHFHLQPGGPE
jgi:hypothetical protein